MLEKFLLGIIKEKIFLGALIGTLTETIFPPIPSEVILPLAGYFIRLSNLGTFGLLYGIFFASVGATLGALFYYYLSLFIGRRLVEKYGKYFFIDKKKLKVAENWLKKYGKRAVFFGRMAPGVRELISIPAGLLKMNFVEYVFYTFLGSFVWSFFLIMIGYVFGETSLPFAQKASNIVFLIVILSLASYLIFRKMVEKSK